MLLSHRLAKNFRRVCWLRSIHNGRDEIAKVSAASVLAIIVAAIPAVWSSTVAACVVVAASAILVARSSLDGVQSRGRQDFPPESSGDHFCRWRCWDVECDRTVLDMGDEGHHDPVSFIVSGIFDVGAAENAASDNSISVAACISSSAAVVVIAVTAICVSVSAVSIAAAAAISISVVAPRIAVGAAAARARIPMSTINKHIAQGCRSDDRAANFGRDDIGVSRGGQDERGLRVLDVCEEDAEAGEFLDSSLGGHIQRIRSLFDARRVVCRGRCRGCGGDGPQEAGHSGLGRD
jgi:hypothetical protein